MTQNESIKAIKDYLRYSNVWNEQFDDIIFEDEQATLNGKTIFTFDYDNGTMDLLTLDYDNICTLDMNTLTDLFPSLYYQVNCDSCGNGGKRPSDNSPSPEYVECECSDVIYKN